MKTTLLLLSFLILTVSETYGQATDSVKISVPQFFAMERVRRDYELLKVQFIKLESSNITRGYIIDAQMKQIKAINSKYEAVQEFNLGLEKDYKTQKRKLFFYKVLTPVALVGGFLLGAK